MCLKVKHKFEGVTTPCTMQDAVTGRILLQAITATVGARVGTASTARVWCITTITRWLVVILVVLGRLLLLKSIIFTVLKPNHGEALWLVMGKILQRYLILGGKARGTINLGMIKKGKSTISVMLYIGCIGGIRNTCQKMRL